jgi:NitT/TauT family transport system substrate-binding protein
VQTRAVPSRSQSGRKSALPTRLLGLLAIGLLVACSTAPASAPASQPAGAAKPAQPASGASGQAAAPVARAPEQVSLRLDFLPWGPHPPFFLALERGYYAAEGIEVNIQDGRGSPVTVQTVGSGSDQFGLAAVSSTALGIGEGIPVRSVAVVTNRNTFGFIYDESAPMRAPVDFYGKTVLTLASGPEFAMIQATYQKNGLDHNRVQLRNVDAAAKYSTYSGGTADAVVGPIPIMPVVQPRRPSRAMPFADFGLNVQDYSVFTNLDTLNNKPQVVGGFVRASIKGWEEARSDPAAATQALLKYRPDANAELIQPQLVLMMDYLFSSRTAGRAIGWSSEEDWRDALQVL